jgi:hypothetical protein
MLEYRLPLGRASAAGNVNTSVKRVADFEGASTPDYGGQAHG